MPLPVTIKEIYIYPLKSAAGVSLQVVKLDSLGFSFDRRWMIVNKDFHFVTQRQDARLANIQPMIKNQSLVLTAPSVGVLNIDLSENSSAGLAKRFKGIVWDRQYDVDHCGSIASDWISSYLGYEAHIVRLPASIDNKLSRSFVDSSQVLIISQESLDALNQRLKIPIGIERFRPNIVVQCCDIPNAEDAWHTIRIRDTLFQNIKPCTRCVMITIDQSTLAKNPEPLGVLADYRRQGSAVIFGQYYSILTIGQANIGVGDTVFPMSLTKRAR